MKYIILFIVGLISFQPFAQGFDCEKLIKTFYDDVSGYSEKQSIKGISIIDSRNNSMLIYPIKDTKGNISIRFGLVTNGCIDDNSQVNILFTDGSRYEKRGINKYNCDGLVVLKFYKKEIAKKPSFNDLITKSIKIIRVHKFKGYVEVNLTEEDSKKLRDTLICLKES